MILPAPLIIFLVSIAPMIDRGAIPLGVFGYDMSLMNAFLIFSIGNVFISYLIYFSVHPVCVLARNHSKFFDDIFTELFKRTRKNHSKKMNKLGLLALFIFVAAPVPGGGSYVGAMVAYVFDVKAKKALPILGSGLIFASTMIALGTAGVIPLIR